MLYFDGALVAPPPACADTSDPKDKIAAAIAMVAVLLYIEFSVGLRRPICAFPHLALIRPLQSI